MPSTCRRTPLTFHDNGEKKQRPFLRGKHQFTIQTPLDNKRFQSEADFISVFGLFSASCHIHIMAFNTVRPTSSHIHHQLQTAHSAELTVTSAHFMSLKCHFLNRIQYRSCYLYSLSSITVHHRQLVIFGQRCVYWPYVGAATVSVSQYKMMGQSFLSPLTTLPPARPGNYCVILSFPSCALHNICSSLKYIFFPV